MSFQSELVDLIINQANPSKVFTYPGSPPRYLYKNFLENDIEINQVVREQHLLHLAQTRYYRLKENGQDEIPVVIVSGEMGEAMMFQPLLSGSITCPVLILVAEAEFEHIDNSINIAHQTDRGKTPEKLGEKEDLLHAHENIVNRKLINKDEDLDNVQEWIREAREQKGALILHVPTYTEEDLGDELNEVLQHKPRTTKLEETKKEWRNSEKRMFIVGRGMRNPEYVKKIEKAAENSGAVIATTMQMEGYFDTNYVGRIGIMGTPSANKAFKKSEKVLALGTSIHNVLTSFKPSIIEDFQQKVVQVELNPERRSIFAEKWLETDFNELIDFLTEVNGENWFEESYNNELLFEHIPENVLKLGEIISKNYSNKVVNLGVGNSTLWLPYALGPEVKKETSRSGSMGEVIAGLNREDKPIIVMGDGEFEMDLSVITEAQYQDTQAKIFVINNERLGLVTERQEKEFGERLTPKINPIDYEKIAEPFENVESYSFQNPSELEKEFEQIISTDKISIIELKAEKKLNGEFFSPYRLPGYNQEFFN